MNQAISLRDVSKRFKVPLDRSSTLKHRIVHFRSAGTFRVLEAIDKVSFDVEYGEFLGIIGNNGSGKSTLLKILAKIYQPTSGSVVINSSVSPFLELGVGFDPELTARENIFLNGTILGLTRREIGGKVEEVLDFSELHDFADQKVKNFSSGMQVRLAFAVAIQAHAGILLMDEVLAVGDANFQQKCIDVFGRYRREGRTVILVTHDLSSVEQYCDRAILLDHGQVVEDGLAQNVVRTNKRLNAERAEANFQEQGPTEAPMDRWGSKEVTVTKVEIPRVVKAGEPTTISFFCAVNQPVADLVCMFSILRTDGHSLVSADSRAQGIEIADPPVGKTLEFVYHTERLPLASGNYVISADLLDRHGSHPYDHVDEAATFKVTDESGETGFLVLGGKWSATEVTVAVKTSA